MGPSMRVRDEWKALEVAPFLPWSAPRLCPIPALESLGRVTVKVPSASVLLTKKSLLCLTSIHMACSFCAESSPPDLGPAAQVR